MHEPNNSEYGSLKITSLTTVQFRNYQFSFCVKVKIEKKTPVTIRWSFH